MNVEISPKKITEIFLSAFDLAPAERERFLAESCDEKTRREVESLFAAHTEAGSFLEDVSAVSAVQKFYDENANLSGKKINHFRLIREIGRGGMGVVFLAEREDFHQQVALKLIKRGMDSDAISERFRREREILASLTHPFIARLLDGGTTDQETPYFVMEYVEGTSVDEYCRAKNLSEKEKLELFRKICEAVSFAHQKFVVHRDLKPSNILVTADGTPKLLDFGIAKLLNTTESNATQTNQRALTPAYASPEQIRGEIVGTTGDVYSLGIILKELLTDTKTVDQNREPENDKPKSAKRTDSDLSITTNNSLLKGDLQNIVSMALREDSTRRYDSVDKFSEDIRRYLADLPISARKDSFRYRAAKFTARNKIGVAAVIIVLILLIGGVSGILWEAHQARLAQAQAERRFNDVRQITNSFMFELNDEIQKGPTKAREMLVKKALEYLDNLAQESSADPSLQIELATAYSRVGDIQGQPYHANLGDTGGALASYGKAREILESLSSSGAKNPDILNSLCLIYQKTGWLKTRVGDWDAALENGLREIKTAELLIETDKTNSKYLGLLSAGHLLTGVGTYGGVRSDSIEENKQALENFRQAASIDEDLYKSDPENSQLGYSVLSDHSYIGYALWNIGDLSGNAENYRAALTDFHRSEELADTLYKTEPNSFQRTKADTTMDYGREQVKLDDMHGAIETFRQALSIFEEIAAIDPNNIEARRDVADGYRNVSVAAAKMNDISMALTESRQTLTLYESLHNLNPTDTENLFSQVLTYNVIADCLDQTNRQAEAQNSRLKARTILENLSKANLTGGQVRHSLAEEDASIAREFENFSINSQNFAKQQENWKQSCDWYQRSFEEWQQLRDIGMLSNSDNSKVDAISLKIGKCNTTLQSKQQ